jgi:non-ribosomal peptide synthetase component F
VAAVYAALRADTTPDLASPRPYRDYVAWLGKQDPHEAESHWRRVLSGFERPPHLAATTKPGGYKSLAFSLSEEFTATLVRFAREHRLTLNTFAQGAMVLLLSGRHGRRDVCFGVTSSGRPAEIMGVESMVGMFLSTTPLRVVLDDGQPVLELLAKVQAEQLTARRFEYASLPKIQAWSPYGPGQRLFDAVLVFTNQPAERNTLFADDEREGAYTSYPLMVTVSPGVRLGLHFEYQAAHLTDTEVRQLQEHFVQLLHAMVANPYAIPADLPPFPAHADTEEVMPDLLAHDAVGEAVGQRGDDPVRAMSPEEAVLADIWAHALDRDSVGTDDNFFAIGGDSIASIRVVALAASRGLHFTPADVFDLPTVAQLAAVVRREQAVEAEPVSEQNALLKADVMAKLSAFFAPKS